MPHVKNDKQTAAIGSLSEIVEFHLNLLNLLRIGERLQGE